VTGADVAFSLTIVGMNLACFWMGRSIGKPPAERQPIGGARHKRWVRLPSGYAHDYAPGVVGYVMATDDGAYWWLARHGRTIIEGPCPTVDAGKREVAQAAREWVGWAASSIGRA
jgi:hypothetical protein